MDKAHGLERFFEILPGALAWGAMILLLFFSIFYPKALAVVMIFYIVFWLLRVFFMAYRIILGYVLHCREMKLDWLSLTENLPPKGQWRRIYHLVIVPTYKEDIEIIRGSIKSVYDSDYPKDRII